MPRQIFLGGGAFHPQPPHVPGEVPQDAKTNLFRIVAFS
jgi:hypothetical protein